MILILAWLVGLFLSYNHNYFIFIVNHRKKIIYYNHKIKKGGNMQCPVCNSNVNDMARHFVSKFRLVNDEDGIKHLQYIKEEKKQITDYVNSFFETNLTLRQARDKVNEKYINLTFKSLRIISKIWIRTFGKEEYDKRVKRLNSGKSKKMWLTRDKSAIKHLYEFRIQSAKDRTALAIENTNKILSNRVNAIKFVDNVNENIEIKDHLSSAIQCRLCGNFFRALGFHCMNVHSITSMGYKILFPNEPLVCQESIDSRSKKLISQGLMRKIRFFDESINIEKEVEIAQYRKKMFRLVRGRDICCQECDKIDSNVDIHHIVPHRLFSRYDFEMHDPDNLILLCDQCHAIYGQELDQIIIEIFARIIQVMHPFTYKYVIAKLKFEEKLIFKRKVGAPKLYNVTANDVDKAKVDGKVMISKAIELMPNVPKRHIVKACRDNNMTFINPECLTKNLKTKICPVCGWSGSFKFSKHVKTNDDKHQSFLRELERLYINEKLGCDKIAEVYSEYNFTREIVEAILKDAGIYYKILQEEVA
jgi:hypothetical protein